MEESFSKRTILILFAIIICTFLFIHKGFVLNGDQYNNDILHYKQSLYQISYMNNKTSLTQATLKRSKQFDSITNKNEVNKLNKGRIPIEISMIDNSLLEIKALLHSINDKHTKIKSIISTKDSPFIPSPLFDEISIIQKEQITIEGGLEDISLNIQKLRESFQ